MVTGCIYILDLLSDLFLVTTYVPFVSVFYRADETGVSHTKRKYIKIHVKQLCF